MVSATPHVNYAVSGLLVPEPLSGDSALELCNTLAGWGEPSPREYLASYRHLVVWARERGLVAPDDADALAEEGAACPRDAERVLARARALRAALYAVATGGAGDADRAVVAREAERAWAGARLRWQGGRAEWALPRALDLPVLAAARAAAAFAADPPRVGRCPGRGCGWLFADPGGRRRWCSMAVCGNRAKQRRYVEREAARREG